MTLAGLELAPGQGQIVVFAWSFLVQLGLPVPAIPMLLGSGALAGLGQMSLPATIATAVGATLLADTTWYGMGRVRGNWILETLSRFSLGHAASIRRAKQLFFAHRAQCLIVAKFLPGTNPLAVGLAGIFAVTPAEFLVWDATGALLWAGAWITVGYFCASMISAIVHEAARIGAPLLGLAAAGLVVFFVVRHMVRRHRFLRQLAEPRLSAEDLKQRLDGRAPIMVIDLRTALDLASVPVLRHIHILGGGIEAWRRCEYPVEPIPASAEQLTSKQ